MSKWSETYVNIPVKKQLSEKLLVVRRELNARSWSELFEKLLDIYGKYVEMKDREAVRRVMCNDMSESSASIVGWSKILMNKLEPRLIPVAFEYLTQSREDPLIFIVDKKKCVE